jgi:hypothetical protein
MSICLLDEQIVVENNFFILCYGKTRLRYKKLFGVDINYLLFSAKKYPSHINRDNKNGYHGELISAFDYLIQELWSGNERYVSASKLKVSACQEWKKLASTRASLEPEMLNCHRKFIRMKICILET